jgi:hypothetical protein
MSTKHRNLRAEIRPTTPSQEPGTVRMTFLTLIGAFYLGSDAKGKSIVILVLN